MIEENGNFLVLEVGRIEDISPCNEVVFFLDYLDALSPDEGRIDPAACLVRRISHVGRPELTHYEAGPAFQVEHAITGEVYVSHYFYNGLLCDPDIKDDFVHPAFRRETPVSVDSPPMCP